MVEWVLPLLGLGQLALAVDNLGRFQKVPVGGPALQAQVAILIPARDEAPRIAACVRAALAQDVAEVLVLDDGSTDGTAELARASGATRVLTGAPLPAGWTGKGYACWTLAAATDAAWLVFVDADVALAPGAIAEAIRRAQALDAGLLSFWPRQVLGTPGERLLVPLLDVVLLGFLPFALAERRPDPSLAAANGQCLVFRADAYRQAGGHAAVRADVVEDVALARAMKRAGGRVVLTDAGELASVRMYGSLAEAWAGFRKNLYPAFGGRPGPFLVGLGLFAALHALPLPGALAAFALGYPVLGAALAAQALMAWALRGLLVARLGHPVLGAVAHPVGSLLVVALALASWRAAAAGNLTWKGRAYGLQP